ncbi:TPA: AraC family transcriptional regulator [Escherichia coli]|nr:AraC family transcriptional regulator [Escherichia coli]HAW7687639.1 AraC family transcriptional regulator [Escherichia coli]
MKNYQYSWKNMDSMREDINIRVNNFCIIYAFNCILNVKVYKEDTEISEEVAVNRGQFLLLEKHSNVSLQIMKFTNEKPYEYLELHKEDIDNVLKIMEPMYNLDKPTTNGNTLLEKKTSIIDNDDISGAIFKKIKENDNARLRAYEIAYLFSMSREPDKLFVSLSRSATIFFCDVVRKLIESNTAKKWQLSLLSYEMNLSEITIRKKLESENTSFYQILLDVRMQKAAKLILKNDLQVSKVAKMVGISSTSYFIRIFNSYYGVTPKNYFMYHKGIVFDTAIIGRKISQNM